MTFFESIMTCYRKMLVTEERARRSELWWFFLFAAAIFSIAIRVGATYPSYVLKFLCLIVMITTGISLATAFIRRLHDAGVSSWWVLTGAVPIVGWAVLVGFCLRNSAEGPNYYGPNPKGIGEKEPKKNKKSKKKK